MPMLPLIDLLILVGWTSLMVGIVQKALWVATTYRWTVVGLTPMDFLVGAGVCLLFALTLAARAWVKLNEPRILTHGRRRDAEDPAGLDVAWPGQPVSGAVPARPMGADGRPGAAAGR